MAYTLYSHAHFVFLRITWGNQGSEESLSATTRLASSSARILTQFYLFAGPKVSTNVSPWEAGMLEIRAKVSGSEIIATTS